MKDGISFSEIRKKEQDTIIRAMFYNIFGYKWYPDKANNPHLNSGPISLRQRMQADLISAYAPDVLGMQEYCAAYHKGMTPLLLEIGYQEVNVSHIHTHADGTKLNYTAIFYRPDTLSLIDQGFLMYPETMPDPAKNDGSVLVINDVSSKSLTWAVFEQIVSKKRFVAICTHFMYSAPWLTSEQQNAVRVENAKSLINLVKTLRAQSQYHELPILVGGDLNSTPDSDPFNTLKKGGMEWLWDVVQTKDYSRGIKQYATYDEELQRYVEFQLPDDNPFGAIDYIWHLPSENTKNIEFINYLTVTDQLALLSSDHCPRFTDFELY